MMCGQLGLFLNWSGVRGQSEWDAGEWMDGTEDQWDFFPMRTFYFSHKNSGTFTKSGSYSSKQFVPYEVMTKGHKAGASGC